MQLRNMSDYTLARSWDATAYHYDCSRCQQVFALDAFWSRLLDLGEIEVEIELCYDCQQSCYGMFPAPSFHQNLHTFVTDLKND